MTRTATGRLRPSLAVQLVSKFRPYMLCAACVRVCQARVCGGGGGKGCACQFWEGGNEVCMWGVGGGDRGNRPKGGERVCVCRGRRLCVCVVFSRAEINSVI